MTATQMGAEPVLTEEPPSTAHDKAKAVVDEAAGRAGEVASSTAADAKALLGDAKGEAVAVAGEAKAKAKDLAADARLQLRQQADEQAGRAAAAMRELSDQLSTMAGSADGGLVPDLARQASSTIDGVARRLDDGGLDTLVADVKRYARNKPGTFLLGAAALGLLAGRLAKSADTQALLDAAKSHDADAGPTAVGGSAPAPALDLTAAAPAPLLDPVATQPMPAEPVTAERPLQAPGS